VELSLNRTIGNTQDNVAVPSWFLSLAAHPAVATASPGLQLTRVNEGDTSDQLIAFVIDNSGNLTIGGPSGFKTTGTAWENPSDPRIKRNAALYTTGLAAILNLDPISFFFNGKGGTVDDGQQCYGFDASAVRAVLPECVGVRRGKLDDDETDILTLDTSNFTLALINAVKELAMRVAVLEAR
jgi:hypothetical protein